MASEDSQPFHWHYTEFDDRSFEIRGRTLFFIIVLFSIILLVTLLFLYARWVCRFHHLSTASNSAPHLIAPPLPPPRGLDAAIINGLPIILHRPSSATTGAVEESECCICLTMFQDGDKVKVLPECQHFFHSECVDRWLNTESSCPLCRVSLQAEPVVDLGVPQIVIE